MEIFLVTCVFAYSLTKYELDFVLITFSAILDKN